MPYTNSRDEHYITEISLEMSLFHFFRGLQWIRFNLLAFWNLSDEIKCVSSIGNGGSGAVFEKLLRNGHSLYYLPQQTIRKLNHCFSTFQRIF